jgi:hypothetical protein
MNLPPDFLLNQTRRHFFAKGRNLMGTAALASLMGPQRIFSATGSPEAKGPVSHFPAKAKRVIYLHMVGGPSQMDLYDYKPEMMKWFDKDLPESVRKGQRLTTMTSRPGAFPIAPSKFKFASTASAACGSANAAAHRPSASTTSASCVAAHRGDQPRARRSRHADRHQVPGRPCFGAWASYGLGSMNENLPTFVVLVAAPTNREQSRRSTPALVVSGFLPGHHQGVSFRTQGRPDPLPQQPARRCPTNVAGRCSTASHDSTDDATRPRRRSETRRGSSSTRWPSACRRASPS